MIVIYYVAPFFVRLDDEIWEVRLHFQVRDNLERKFSLPTINFLTLIASIELEGYGINDYMSYVKEEGKGLEGVEFRDSEEKVEEMFDPYLNEKIVNIIVSKSNEPRPADINMGNNIV